VRKNWDKAGSDALFPAIELRPIKNLHKSDIATMLSRNQNCSGTNMAKAKLSDLLSRQVVLADGAMGTMLYQQGVFLNACFDELNLSNPKLVSRIHQEYVEAGVDFIETNTFGANEVKLARYGLAEQVEKINAAGVELAKKVAGERILVAGAMGPLACDIGHT
jgi:methionine synthase I (cobalamin-dependent)